METGEALKTSLYKNLGVDDVNVLLGIIKSKVASSNKYLKATQKIYA